MIQEIAISRVFMRKDARKIDEAAVRRLVDSIGELGIINPLRVRPAVRMVNGVEGDAFETIAGNHRLKAAIKAGLETVPCIVVDDDDLRAELAMIDENLMRSELSAADRAEQTARRKAIYEELHPETKHGGDRQGGQVANFATSNFVKETASCVGKSERSIRLDAERGEKIVEEAIELIRGTELDSGVYLDKLKKAPAKDQVSMVQKALRGIATRQSKEKQDTDDRRRASRLDADIKDRAAKEIADIISEHVPADFWDCIKANLAVTDTKRILCALANDTGHSKIEAAYASA